MFKKLEVKITIIRRVIKVVWSKPTGGGLLLHEFFLSRNHDNPYCYGIEGALSTYQYPVRTVPLYGPSHLVPVIRHVANFVAVMLTQELLNSTAAHHWSGDGHEGDSGVYCWGLQPADVHHWSIVVVVGSPPEVSSRPPRQDGGALLVWVKYGALDDGGIPEKVYRLLRELPEVLQCRYVMWVPVCF